MLLIGPTSSTVSPNRQIAKHFVIEKILSLSKPTKKAQNILQAAAAARAGFEIQQCFTTAMKLHGDKKYKEHFAAYERHVDILFTCDLLPFKDRLPFWLNRKWLLQRDLEGKKSYNEKDPHLWHFFEKINREVKRDYIPLYQQAVVDQQGADNALEETLEKLRGLLWLIEPAQKGKTKAEDKVLSL